MTESPLELASDIARIRGLYKLLPVSSPMRVLEIIASNETSVFFENNASSDIQLISANIDRLGYTEVASDGVQIHSPSYLFDGPNGADRYDLIIMHGTFSRLKTSLTQAGKTATNQEIFGALNRLLGREGIIAGCIQNRLSSRGLISLATQNVNAPCLSFRGLKRSLETSGFEKPRIFSLYPGRFSPINLAEVNTSRSVAHSRSQIDYLENWLGKPNYRLKLLLSLLGISLWFEDEYFYYAIKS